MTSQASIIRSSDGRYIVAQVHDCMSLVEASTGALITLPTPVFTRIAEGKEGEDGDDSEGEDGADNGDGDAAAADADEEKDQQPKKKRKQEGGTTAAASAPGKGQRSHDGPKPIRVVAFHPNNEWLMYASEDKYIHLYHIAPASASSSSSSSSSSPSSSPSSGAFRYILTIPISRKVQCGIFHPSRFSTSTLDASLQLPSVFAADKTGDIYLITGADLKEHQLKLGHLANITQLEYYSHTNAEGKKKSYLLSSDSDGKIRVSNVPNLFDIQSFCLGHQAFVSTFDCITSTAGPLIVSGGLSAEIIVWRLSDGVQVAKAELQQDGTIAASAAAASSSSSSAPASSQPTVAECYVSQVTRLSSNSAPSDSHTVFVSVYPWASAFVLNVTPTAITIKGTTKLPTLANSSSISDDQLLFIDETLRVRAFSVSNQAELGTSASTLQTAIMNLNTPLTSVQSNAASLLITHDNASSFVGVGLDGKADHPGRYVSPFSSLHTEAIVKLSLLSPAGFTYRRYADKVKREAFISAKKQEAAQKRAQAKQAKQEKKEANKRQKQNKGEEAMEE